MPALTPADLPNATVHIKKTSGGGGGFLIQVRHPEDWIMGELRIAIPLGMGECHGAYEVTSSLAEVRGLGPLLYDIAMELAGKRGIMSDRRSVSHDARRVWKFYDSRGDTKKKQLDNPQGWLTPEDDSDDCRQDSAGKNWVESPLSRVNYKNSTPVLDDLRRRGMLRMAGGSRTAVRRLSASRVASWVKVKRFFPGVRNPVFHATTGPRAASIALRSEGIRSNSGVSNFGAGNMGSISLSRDLSFLLKGGFGNVIFVLDRDELSRKFPVNPLAYPDWEDEYEERVFTDKIPPSMIRGVIFRYKPLGFELGEWESKVDCPLVYIEGREWRGSKTASVKTATTIPEILGNCGPDVTQRADKVKYKRKRLSPSGLSTWSATGSKGEEYVIRVKPIRKDKRLKQVAKMPVQIACSCPYFRWQGPEHWAVQNDYLYGKPRGSASVPVIKDPLSEHWACKHTIAVLRLVQKYRYAGEGGWDWTGPVVPVSPHELNEDLVKRVASIGVYKPLSEAGPKVEELLSRRTPTWLDRDYPYVSPPGRSGTLAELDYLVGLIPLRSRWASFIRAADEDAEGLFMSLCSELGVPCDRRTLDEMVSEALVLITKLKWLYNRPRPYQVAEKEGRSDFHVLDSVSAHTPAYPSGHTIQAYLLASRLSELAPQHRGAFMDLAHKISFSRAVAGYHWPSDLTYAKDLYRHIVSPNMPSSIRVAKRFRESHG